MTFYDCWKLNIKDDSFYISLKNGEIIMPTCVLVSAVPMEITSLLIIYLQWGNIYVWTIIYASKQNYCYSLYLFYDEPVYNFLINVKVWRYNKLQDILWKYIEISFYPMCNRTLLANVFWHGTIVLLKPCHGMESDIQLSIKWVFSLSDFAALVTFLNCVRKLR